MAEKELGKGERIEVESLVWFNLCIVTRCLLCLIQSG